MNTIPNTRINSIEQVEQALRTLTTQGYESATAAWAEHRAWLETLEIREPDETDLQWARQESEPSSTGEHFEFGAPEILTAARCHVGRQYTLSPGQREVLRDRYGLTPTTTVVALDVELFPTVDAIWSLTLKSAEHVDPKRRKHVLNEVVLRPASHFFRDSDMKDKEREEEAVKSDGAKRSATPRSSTSIAMAYLT